MITCRCFEQLKTHVTRLFMAECFGPLNVSGRTSGRCASQYFSKQAQKLSIFDVMKALKKNLIVV